MDTTIHEIDGFKIEVTKLGDCYEATIREGNQYWGLRYRSGSYGGLRAGETGGDGVTVYDFPGPEMQEAMQKAIQERIAADEPAT